MIEPRILVTLGPASLYEEVVKKCSNKNVYTFRINLSHTPTESVAQNIKKVQKWTDKPVCLDTEGAQLRNGPMINENVRFPKGKVIKIHYDRILGNDSNISFSPDGIAKEFILDDIIRIDLDSVSIKVFEKNRKYCLAIVEHSGKVGSNKASDIDRELPLKTLTKKDRKAIKIAKKLGVKHFALSFTNRSEDVEMMRSLTSQDSFIISKLETLSALKNINSIISSSADEFIIDRGDLSRQVPIFKIPLIQKRLISIARSKNKPLFVATNLLESMVKTKVPTRAEVNDVISTLLDGANGLVLAAETAIGKYPVDAVRMIEKLIEQYNKWTPNSTINEVLCNDV